MFTHMTPVKKVYHKANGADYELHVYKVTETGRFRIYVSKGAFGVGPIYEVAQETVQDARAATGVDPLEILIELLKEDINRNEFKDF